MLVTTMEDAMHTFVQEQEAAVARLVALLASIDNGRIVYLGEGQGAGHPNTLDVWAVHLREKLKLHRQAIKEFERPHIGV